MKHSSISDCCCVSKGEEVQYTQLGSLYSIPEVDIVPQILINIYPPVIYRYIPIEYSPFHYPLKTVRLLI